MAKLSSTQIFGDLQVDGEIKNKATTTTEGVVQLNDNVNSTSTTQGATANAVKKVNDTVASHVSNTTSHITASERTTWNGKVNKSGDNLTGHLTFDNARGVCGKTTDGVAHNLAQMSSSNEAYMGTINVPIILASSVNPKTNIKGTHHTLYHTGNKPTPADIGAIPLSGSTSITGTLKSNSEFQTTSATGLRLINGNYGAFIRNDGTNTHILLTDSGNQYGGWNSLRPFYINNVSGLVNCENGIKGNLTGNVTGNASTATKLQTARNIGNATFDGAGSIGVNSILGFYSLTGTSNLYNNKYTKIASVNISDGGYSCCTGTMVFTSAEGDYIQGELSYYLRTSSTISSATIALKWLSLTPNKYAGSVYAVKTADGKYDLYFRALDAWMSTQIYSISNTGKITLYSKQPYIDTLPSTAVATSKIATASSECVGNSATATKLQTARTIFGTSFDGSGNVAGQALCYGTYTSSANSRYGTGALQIRECGLVGSAQSDIGYAPQIGFHWSGKVGASLAMSSSGEFQFINQVGTGYSNLRVGTLYGALSGNASTATTLQTARTLTIGNTGKSFNGSGNVSWSLNEMGASPGQTITGTTAASAQWYRIAEMPVGFEGGTAEFYINASGTDIYSSTLIVASVSSNQEPSIQQLSHSFLKNTGIDKARVIYESSTSGYKAYLDVYVPTSVARKITVHMSGSLGWKLVSPSTIGNTSINSTNKVITLSAGKIVADFQGKLTGNADTATKLYYDRTINGTIFKGDENITTKYWGWGRTLTIGNSGKSVDGSKNVSWSLSEIGASPSNHTHTNIPYIDSRAENTAPTSLPSGVSMALKQNTTDGLNDGGIYHASMSIRQWSDNSGGNYHQLGFTDNGNIWYRNGANSSWNGWKMLATTNYYEIVSSDYRNGWSTRGGFRSYLVRSGRTVTLNLSMVSAVGGNGMVVCNIPASWRPKHTMGAVGVVGGLSVPFYAELDSNGNVCVWDFPAGTFGQAGYYTRIQITYYLD